MQPARLHVVRDMERTLAMAAGVAVAFALLFGAVTPGARRAEVRVNATEMCGRDEPGVAKPVEAPAAGPSCPSDREGSMPTQAVPLEPAPPARFPQLSAAGHSVRAGK